MEMEMEMVLWVMQIYTMVTTRCAAGSDCQSGYDGRAEDGFIALPSVPAPSQTD